MLYDMDFCKASSDARKLEQIQELALKAIHNTNTELYENLLRPCSDIKLSYAEPNVNDLSSLFDLICIRFGI